MIEITGIDIGNITTIVVSEDEEIQIESRLKEWSSKDDLGGNEVFEFNGKKYVSESGDFENDVVKHEKENFLPLIFYPLFKATEENQIKAVIGIPAGQYEDRKDELRDFIMANNKQKIKVGNKEREIEILDLKVVPEGYGLKANGAMEKCQKGLKTYVIDIGGGTTDIAEFDENMKFVDGDSIQLGLLDIYRNTRKILSKKPYNMVISLADAKKYFDGELKLPSINEDDEKEKNAYKLELIKDCLRTLINELKGLYPNLSNSNIVLAGGGAKKVKTPFSKIYPQTIVVENIKANARGNRIVGVAQWQKK
ncbi:StbA family protein [[Clostridium] sordellii]|uniref:ParM/StbA family protein n=1 Tax=Paraclostridium sordellii TaxID=1505 RepID=UPI0005DEC81F|nr:ParM/StbA family protein [Paeniclostridium sordellii]CEP50258.1 StbA family protein [[Clostridium] sordellii] [Paeniclostridium sordellii]